MRGSTVLGYHSILINEHLSGPMRDMYSSFLVKGIQ